MLMVAGVDRYYQVARCFRDEDLRADRQPEFTQLDIEMAFTDEEGIMKLAEDLMRAAFKSGVDVDLPSSFPKMTYAEAMEKYGSDKPDLRYGLEMATLDAALEGVNLKSFPPRSPPQAAPSRRLVVNDDGKIPNSKLKPKGDVFNEAVAAGAGGLAFARVAADGVSLEGAKGLVEATAARRAGGDDRRAARETGRTLTLRRRSQGVGEQNSRPRASIRRQDVRVRS